MSWWRCRKCSASRSPSCLSPEIAADKRALKLLADYHKARDAADEAFFDLAEHAVKHERVEAVLREHLTGEDMKSGLETAIRQMRRNTKERQHGEHQAE